MNMFCSTIICQPSPPTPPVRNRRKSSLELRGGELVPGIRSDDGFKKDDALHVVLVAHGVVEAESRPLVMQHQSHVP